MPPLGADEIGLEYTGSVTKDNLPLGARKKWTRITDTLAYERARGALNLYIHGNSDIVVKRGTTDISKHYAPRRRWREWHVAEPEAR